MSNVLPHDARREVRGMYRSRFIVMGALAVTVTCVLSMLVLVPAYLTLHAVAVPSATSTAAADKSDVAAIGTMRTVLKAIEPIIRATTTPSEAINTVLSVRSTGVHVTEVSYQSGKSGVITLLGKADAPSALDSYRKALTALPGFTNVSVPVSDLVGAQDGHFSITITGDF